MTAPIHQHFRLFKPLLIAYQFCLVQPVQLIAIFTKSLFAQKHWPKNKSAIIQFTVKGHSINESFVVTDGNDAVVKRSDNFNATLDQLLLRTQIIYDLSYTRGCFGAIKSTLIRSAMADPSFLYKVFFVICLCLLRLVIALLATIRQLYTISMKPAMLIKNAVSIIIISTI